nr:hypothetical protein [uncultured Halomonas sp.]
MDEYASPPSLHRQLPGEQILLPQLQQLTTPPVTEIAIEPLEILAALLVAHQVLAERAIGEFRKGHCRDFLALRLQELPTLTLTLDVGLDTVGNACQPTCDDFSGDIGGYARPRANSHSRALVFDLGSISVEEGHHRLIAAQHAGKPHDERVSDLRYALFPSIMDSGFGDTTRNDFSGHGPILSRVDDWRP